jgi:hypothetical protein
MNIVERYLASVAWHLPEPSRADIVNELRDDILSRIEAAESRSGRSAEPAEVAAILKATGHPARIAARYAQRPGLLPAEAVPWWWAHLRALAAIIGVVHAASAVLGIIAGRPIAQAIAQALFQGAQDFLTWLGVLTLVYLGFVRYFYPRMLDSWDPARLPPAETVVPQQRFVHAIGLVFSVAFLLWWTGTITVPAARGLEAGPVWGQLYWPVLVVVSLGVVRGIAEMWMPARQRLLATLSLMIAVGGIAIASFALRNGPLVAAVQGADAREVPGMVATINAVGPIVLAVIVIANFFEGWRSARMLLRPGYRGLAAM